MAKFVLLTVCVFAVFALEKMSTTAKLENGQCFPDCLECSEDCDYRNVTFCCDSQPLNCWENITVCNAKCNGSECSYSVYVKHCCEPYKPQMNILIATYIFAAFGGLTNVGMLICVIAAICVRARRKRAMLRSEANDDKIIETIATPPNRSANQSDSTSAAGAKRTPSHLSSGSLGNDSVSTISEDYALGTPVGGSPPPSYKSRTSSCSNST